MNVGGSSPPLSAMKKFILIPIICLFLSSGCNTERYELEQRNKINNFKNSVENTKIVSVETDLSHDLIIYLDNGKSIKIVARKRYFDLKIDEYRSSNN